MKILNSESAPVWIWTYQKPNDEGNKWILSLGALGKNESAYSKFLSWSQLSPTINYSLIEQKCRTWNFKTGKKTLETKALIGYNLK